MKIVCSALLSGFVLFSLAACGPTEVVRSTRWNVLERQVSIRDEDAADAETIQVVRGDPYQVRVSLSPKRAQDATEQDGRWVFYKDGQLFGRLETGNISFSQGSTVLALDAHSAAKNTGKYRYELYLDDELVAEIPVEIIAAPRFQPAIEP